MASAYEVAPIFLIRLAGVPFDVLAQLATPRSIALARQILAGGGAGKELRAAESDFTRTLEEELTAARSSLLDTAKRILPEYLVFGSTDATNLHSHLAEPIGTRNSRARGREQHLLLYLQRIAAKNDTFSMFGPTAWGEINDQKNVLTLEIKPEVAAREFFLERWTAHAIAGAINADPEKSSSVAVPALEPHAFEVLCDDIARWPDGPARAKWLSILQPIAELPRRFAAGKQTQDRQSIMDDARSHFHALGLARNSGDRSLYAATNPIGEECRRDDNFVVNESFINQIANEAEPWIDFWRDSFAFVASRVAGSLRQILEKAAPQKRTMPLPEFFAVCATAKLPLQGPGLVALAVMAFQEVKGAFREQIRPHIDLADYELTRDDCHVVRNNFDYPKFNEYTYPSGDLQLSAKSVEAANRGEYQWIIGELHPPAALLHHCMYWGCPDKSALNNAFARCVAGKPNFHFGFFAADFTAHTTVRLFDALPQFSNFVAPQRGSPNWKTVSPDQAEVFIDEESGDVCLRKSASRTDSSGGEIDDHEFLGSFARAWIIPLGFHPFQFGLAPHTPRLRCGNVIVQRQTWTISQEELPPGNYTGVSRQLVFAIEQLRAQRNLPRHVYIRPTEQALRRSGAEGRDKDTKPVYIDLESYLFLEIFHRWLTKAGELEVTEMFPDPDHLLWHEPDGHRTFELRTLIVPRS